MIRLLAKRDPLKILISGTAGQGAVFSATLVAEAAAKAGRQVSQTARSSAAVRSGPSAAHVIISGSPVDFPFVDVPDLLIGFSYRAFTPPTAVSKGGAVFYDDTLIKKVPSLHAEVVAVPATRIAKEAGLKDANLVLIGAACRMTEIIPFDALLEQIRTLPPNIRESDRTALLMGKEIADTLWESMG